MNRDLLPAAVIALALTMSFSFECLDAQDFSVSFQAAGASEIVDSVRVENIIRGTSITLRGNDVLQLHSDISIGVSHFSDMIKKFIIYPNPGNYNTYFEFTPGCNGKADIVMYDLRGKLTLKESFDLYPSPQKFHLSGAGKGIYFITVTGGNYQYSGKLISVNPDFGTVRIEQLSKSGSGTEFNDLNNQMRSNDSWLSYTAGERLKLTGYSGVYSTTIFAEPVSDMTITFDFETDGDEINYQVEDSEPADTSMLRRYWTERARPFIQDGNTVAWYKFNDLTTIIKDSGNHVVRWNDKLGSGHDLIQAKGARQPIWSVNGILFDGFDDFLKTAPFAYKHPEYIYLVVKQVSWTAGDYLFDGNKGDSGLLSQNYGSADLAAYAGRNEMNGYGCPLDKYAIIRVFFSDDGTGKIQINDGLPATGNSITNMGGITLGALGSANGNFSNIEVKEMICRRASVGENEIYNYLYYTYFFNKLADENSFSSGKLIFSFDDMNLSQVDVIYPLFLSKGIKGTFYVAGSLVGTPGYGTWGNLQTMNSGGMDIQCHTNHHSGISLLTEDEVISEMQLNNKAFIENNLPVPKHLAYPKGKSSFESSLWIRNSRLRETARTSGPCDFILKNSDKYLLTPRYWLDDATDKTILRVKASINEAKFYKKGIMLSAHGASENGGEYEIATAKLISVIDYAKSIGIDIITTSQLSELMKE